MQLVLSDASQDISHLAWRVFRLSIWASLNCRCRTSRLQTLHRSGHADEFTLNLLTLYGDVMGDGVHGAFTAVTMIYRQTVGQQLPTSDLIHIMSTKLATTESYRYRLSASLSSFRRILTTLVAPIVVGLSPLQLLSGECFCQITSSAPTYVSIEGMELVASDPMTDNESYSAYLTVMKSVPKRVSVLLTTSTTAFYVSEQIVNEHCERLFTTFAAGRYWSMVLHTGQLYSVCFTLIYSSSTLAILEWYPFACIYNIMELSFNSS